VLGRGTFGTVFRARDRFTGQIVAVKVIDKVFSSANRARLAFRELHHMRSLTELIGDKQIPIVKLLNAHFDEAYGQLYIIMEYMELDLEVLLASSDKVELIEENVTKILY